MPDPMAAIQRIINGTMRSEASADNCVLDARVAGLRRGRFSFNWSVGGLIQTVVHVIQGLKPKTFALEGLERQVDEAQLLSAAALFALSPKGMFVLQEQNSTHQTKEV
eukprot:390613-Amphidinium_carterae.1